MVTPALTRSNVVNETDSCVRIDVCSLNSTLFSFLSIQSDKP